MPVTVSTEDPGVACQCHCSLLTMRGQAGRAHTEGGPGHHMLSQSSGVSQHPLSLRPRPAPQPNLELFNTGLWFSLSTCLTALPFIEYLLHPKHRDVAGKERNMVPALMSITSWDMGMNKLRKCLPDSLSDEDTGLKVMLASDRGLGEQL